jgi:hypothetical protein
MRMTAHAFFLASPFLIGLVWSVVSPFLVFQIGKRFLRIITRDLQTAGFTDTSGHWQSEKSTAITVAAASPDTHGLSAAAQPASVGGERGAGGENSTATASACDHYCPVPYPLEPKNICSYLVWLVDLPQLVPTILLACVGVVVSLNEGGHLLLTLITCGIAAAVGIIVTIVIITRDPQHYGAVGGFSYLSFGGIFAFAVNLIAAAFIIIGVSV